MNQRARQTVTSSVEKDFYKLLNNSNFGIDCRNNVGNCYLGLSTIIFQKYLTSKNLQLFFGNDTFRDFFSPSLLKDEITQTFQSKIFALNKEEITYEARKKYYERKMAEELDAVDTYEKNKKVKKRKFKNVDEKITECLEPRKTKMIIDFNDRESPSIKSFAVKKNVKSRSLLVLCQANWLKLFTFLLNLFLTFTKNTK